MWIVRRTSGTIETRLGKSLYGYITSNRNWDYHYYPFVHGLYRTWRKGPREYLSSTSATIETARKEHVVTRRERTTCDKGIIIEEGQALYRTYNHEGIEHGKARGHCHYFQTKEEMTTELEYAI